MKIGIVTQSLGVNYGGILQNYALQTVLKRMGHDVWTIDYRKYTWLQWSDMAWRILAHKILGHNVRFGLTPPAKERHDMPLRRFSLENISLTSPRTKHIDYSVVRKYKFDTILVGSDQVWRPAYNPQIEKMFLSFVPETNIRRIAYAASFGTDEWELSSEKTRICAPLAQRFDAISVREASGVDLCRKYLNVDATHVLDPTLLLTADDYKDVCKDVEHRDPFVFAYILDITDEKLSGIRSFAAKKGLPFVVKSAHDEIRPDDSVEKWLSYFRDAAFVITDSFHGTAFSINFGKDFFVYANAKRGNARFDSLLGLFGLQHRMVDSDLREDCNIDWERVSSILDAERGRCMKWISDALF